MPHFILEYPGHLLDSEQVYLLINATHDAANTTKLFDESHIKTRAIPMNHYRLGNEQACFIHAQLRIHNGRTAAQKKQLSQAVLSAIARLNLRVNTITVEVVDMDKNSYAKIRFD